MGRLRLYVFDPAVVSRQLRMRIFAFSDEAKYLHGNLKPESLKSVTEEELKGFPNCDIFWTWDGENYLGASEDGKCLYLFPQWQDISHQG